MSDVYGRRWFKTPEGLAYLERKKKWDAYVAINETCLRDGVLKGMAPDDYAEMKKHFHRQAIVDAQTGEETVIPFSSSSSDDSYGERFDWGWETHLNGSVTYWGEAAKWDPERKTPKLLRNMEKIPEEWYRPKADKRADGSEG
uniref:Uncharacterized protein n=1 Tax=Hemiselmis tepida TaxID=464990 RepID=A0A7S0VZE6_9CRYP|mmetsp:Transcript_34188/g.87626  ORF Transcript_34188/g.87626 Transcript_34188/m.87626 type:complete len:143 (+) Transcript_34188:1-429(+)